MRLGVGDDCAILHAGVSRLHGVSAVRSGAGAEDPIRCAEELVAQCQRALAARGATGAWATLALTSPNPAAGARVDPDRSTDQTDRRGPEPKPDSHLGWVEQFSRTLDAQLRKLGWQLIGGDTTAGPRCVVLTVNGESARSEPR